MKLSAMLNHEKNMMTFIDQIRGKNKIVLSYLGVPARIINKR